METKIWTDAIVEEVRAAREDLLREADYDLGRLHERIVRSQERHRERLVQPPARTDMGKKQIVQP